MPMILYPSAWAGESHVSNRRLCSCHDRRCLRHIKARPALARAGRVHAEHAEAASEALADAIGGAEPATKADRRELEQRLTIKFGSMLIVAVGILLAAVRFFPGPHP